MRTHFVSESSNAINGFNDFRSAILFGLKPVDYIAYSVEPTELDSVNFIIDLWMKSFSWLLSDTNSA